VIQRAWLWMILTLGLGNHQVKASKLLFLKQSPT